VWHSVVLLEYITKEEIYPVKHRFTIAIVNSSYMFRLHSSHHQAVYIRSMTGNYIPVVYVQLQMFSGRDLGLTFHIYLITYSKSI
jgi:hypothetical protein